ncbi:MAG TPA: VacJ family lipoprotein [Myxococcota bacterium]|nr:VacJ family lipoprotein [Myxococcota bacterium]
MGCWGELAARIGSAAAALSCALVAGAIAAPLAAADGEDPWEPMNRGIFRFNEGVDRTVVEPIAGVVDVVLPDPVERAIRRFFENSMFPVRFLNNLLQTKPVSAVEELARFTINTTIGVAGLFDPATHLGIEDTREDFGQTLGVWGVPPGPYLVLPLLGPSSPRDTVGLIADSAARVYTYFVPFYVSTSIGAGDLLNRRSLAIDDIAAERAAALDYYVAVRNAYRSYRENQVRDRGEGEEGDSEDREDQVDREDLYDSGETGDDSGAELELDSEGDSDDEDDLYYPE